VGFVRRGVRGCELRRDACRGGGDNRVEKPAAGVEGKRKWWLWKAKRKLYKGGVIPFTILVLTY
jgi:hypothetical protein